MLSPPEKCRVVRKIFFERPTHDPNAARYHAVKYRRDRFSELRCRKIPQVQDIHCPHDMTGGRLVKYRAYLKAEPGIRCPQSPRLWVND